MRDLETQIAHWRRQMLAAGIKSPVPLEELESHLRDHLEQQIHSGQSPQDAFAAAVQRLGPVGELRAEFAKVGEAMSAKQRQTTWRLCGLLAVTDALIGVAWLLNVMWWIDPFLPEPLSLRNRILGALGWFLFPAILWSWRYFARYLPVFPSKGKRLTIALLTSALGLLGTVLLMQFIPQHSGLEGTLVPEPGVAVWAFLPAVIGISLFFGLEEAAYQKLTATR